MNGYPRVGPVLQFVVFGDPVGQGALSPNGPGRGSRHSNAKTLKPWREKIGEAAQAARPSDPGPRGEGLCWPLRGALAIDKIYTVALSPTAAKQGRRYPTVTSPSNADIDHFDRALHDALKLGEIIADDVLVVDGYHAKTYPVGRPWAHPLALDQPGAVVRIYLIGEPG